MTSRTLFCRSLTRSPVAIACGITVLHFVFLSCFFAPGFSTPDASGYFTQGKLLATEGRSWFTTESPAQYVPTHWHDAGDGQFYSKYPPGLPLLLALVHTLFGPVGALWVNPILASLSVFGIYLVGRAWIGHRWGLLGAGLIATLPVLNEHAHFAFAHTAVVFLVVWSLVCITRWEQTGSARWALLAGLLAGAIPTVRYPEALLLLAFAAYGLLKAAKEPEARKSFAVAALGAAVPIAALCIRNHLAFGAFWRTAYTIDGPGVSFGMVYFVAHFPAYLSALLNPLAGPLFVTGLAGMAVLISRQNTRLHGILLALLVVPTTALYMAYSWPAGAQSSRFLLPTVPAYVLATVWLLKRLAEKDARIAHIIGGTVLVATLAWGIPASLYTLHELKARNSEVAQTAALLDRHVEEGSIVITERRASDYLDYLGRWRLIGLGPGRGGGPPGLPFLQGMMQGMGPAGFGPGAPGLGPGPEGRPPMGGPGMGRIARDPAEALSRAGDWAGDSLRVYVIADENQIEELESSLSMEGDLVVRERVERSGVGMSGAVQGPPRAGMPMPGRGPMRGGTGRRPGIGMRPGRAGPGGFALPGTRGRQGDLVLAEWARNSSPPK